MNNRALPAHIAIVGGGPVALAAATAFAQALRGVAVTLVPTPVPEAALADRWPLALPSAHAMLARLGCPPDLLLARGVAVPRAASRFLDWSIDGAPWLVADEPVPGAGTAALHQLWLRAGTPIPFHALHPASVAAEAGGVAAGAEVALHLEAARLSRALASLARQGGVVVAAAPLLDVLRADGEVAAVKLADGGRVTADLFVDATGPARLLATAAGFEEWRDSVPCDRVTIETIACTGALLDSYRATDTGWVADWPGARVTAGPDGGVAITPGRLAEAIRGNVLALGEAAVQPGPLGRAGFTLALAQIALALELLPTGHDTPLLAGEYNRRAGQRADRMRDFLAAHYHGGGRRGPGAVPPSLVPILEQFRRRGSVPAADEDCVERDAWIAVLLGQGLRPERADPIALGIPPDVARRDILDRATRLRTAYGKPRS
ncbi:tryptophan 7-halogenase [Sphingomonas endophytica]|uniref:Tryptophan halogenase n=1 Tax=Sphingomonas endophytica TaxID=869719 RepID=A0A147I4F3_9SPHN|nr:tryptophan 7-halogenase [Sphingomonas endophytica]KTT73054.1 hypothetical protein NS334_07780 [Sphingomonas endophytica]